jgi:hypothetical protein
MIEIKKSRNKQQGKYKGKRFGRHFRSMNKLIGAIREDMGNPFYKGPTRAINM